MITHIERCERGSQNYPRALNELNGMPENLYYKGNISILNEMKSVAIIGSRECSEKALSFSYETGAIAARNNIAVINGLALGCDTAAIKGALSIGGKCVAIMPAGLNSIYPKSNSVLADEILKCGGCLISEYAPDIEPKKYTYVQRDRLQSALSQGIFVVEADLDSGTMHTVEAAIKQRKVMAAYLDALVEASGNRYVIDKKGREITSIQDFEKYLGELPSNEEIKQLSLWDL